MQPPVNSTGGARVSLPVPRRPMTTPQATRGGAIRQPLPPARARTAYDPRAIARMRRRRMVVRLLPALTVVGLFVFGLSRVLGGASPASPAEVASDIREEVTRTVVDRTDDYSATVGPLDCVELQPGRGNCLADVKLASHRSDNVMVAVTYVDDGGDYELLVKMP